MQGLYVLTTALLNKLTVTAMSGADLNGEPDLANGMARLVLCLVIGAATIVVAGGLLAYWLLS